MTVSNRFKRHVWLKLIPVRYARHIILPLEVTILLRTYLLPFDPQIMLEVVSDREYAIGTVRE